MLRSDVLHTIYVTSASCQQFIEELPSSWALSRSLTFSDRLVMMLMPFLFSSTSLTFIPIFPVISGPPNAVPCTSTRLSGDL